MDKKTMQFFLFSIVVMAVFAVFVRGVLLAPKQTAAGPELVSHEVNTDTSCDVCHRKEVDWHKDTFGYFDDCMDCHGGAPNTPHPTGGSYSFCLSCHEDIVPSHDAMFPSNVSYDDCLGCHIPN
ncbi:MAG: hypothetical protein SCK29_05430 [Bacillota bacterium]|nr:hypothetical protein [Bacillota bacterium]MDW7683545.1 hypothetical protein [Bacillota bacterium]